MFNFIFSTTSIGLEQSSSSIKGACFASGHQNLDAVSLFALQPEIENVKRLYTNNPVVITAVNGKEVLVRSMYLPLTKDKDIQEALIFQSEPLLPYTSDQALLSYQVVSKTSDNTNLTLLAVHKDSIQQHIQAWQSLQIEPEKIACIPSALCHFGSAYLPASLKTYLILHFQHQEMTCVLIKDGKLLASFAQSEGLDWIVEAKKVEGLASLPQTEAEWREIEEQKDHPLAVALKRLQKESTKMGYALMKECKSDTIEGIAVTGEVAEYEGLSQIIIQNLKLPLLTCQATTHDSSSKILSYAVPIGLALGVQPNQSQSIDFRQQEYEYPYPWRRLRSPVALYFFSIFLLTIAFYFFGRQYLQNQENKFKQSYVNLLAGMNKSYDDFEATFAAKNSKSQEFSIENLPKIQDLNQEDLKLRLAFLQKELQATPDSFPLLANTPRVSDVLAWLSQHPAVVEIDKEGNRKTKLKIENFNYVMLKRPQQGKKIEKYQVKVELEFSTPTPKWAREFHDALIALNEWVDPKSEIKWNSNRGKYRTSFFLKDKTAYPSL